MTTIEKFHNFPPILVRLLARHRYGRPFTELEIANKAAMALHWVENLSWRTDWGMVNTLDALAFMRGCGLDIDDTIAWRRTIGYLRHKPTFRYLRASEDWEKLYKPLLVNGGNCDRAES